MSFFILWFHNVLFQEFITVSYYFRIRPYFSIGMNSIIKSIATCVTILMFNMNLHNKFIYRD
jgi:hypothetical protein